MRPLPLVRGRSFEAAEGYATVGLLSTAIVDQKRRIDGGLGNFRAEAANLIDEATERVPAVSDPAGGAGCGETAWLIGLAGCGVPVA